MTDARREWISKRAYSIWEEAGRPHGHDGEHWEQAARERDEFEQVALAPETKAAKKPLIEISTKAQAKKAETAKPKKKAEAAAEKPLAAKAAAKAKSAKTAANSKPI
ncbi:DUF2934 domain-containing protein [Shinella zoogloeoides]|uniref:DUF2934 domain-containing protein n=1 Tax=Shinella zoogloeoides TaxID=352475 RepID=UPI00273D3039|nr:DUF2934 domain-containing protein [Shinella zoogloeoides]WLR95160.1 DUF2934 domain-containing protein [Shinella zoogloeoides]